MTDIFTAINPTDWPPPRGYSNGMLAGNILFIAGQIGWDKDCQLVGDKFSQQFEQALANVIAVVKAAGGEANCLGRLTIYVTNKEEYLAELKEVGAAYRNLMGHHYPAMALVEVKSLLEPKAKVEIEATAIMQGAGIKG